MAQPTPYYGGNTPYSTSSRTPLTYTEFPRGRGQYVQLAGLRGLRGAGDDSKALGPAAATFGALAGSATAGALTGYLASGKGRGALTGASFLGGVAALADAGAYFSADAKGSAIFMGLLGITGVSVAIYRLKH